MCPRPPSTLAKGQAGVGDSLPEPERRGFPMITPLCSMPRAQPPCRSPCNKPAVSISSLTHIRNLNTGGTADCRSASRCSTSSLLPKWRSEMKRKTTTNLRQNWVNDCATGSGKRSLGVSHPRVNALPLQITSINVMGYEKCSLCHTTWREDRR